MIHNYLARVYSQEEKFELSWAMLEKTRLDISPASSVSEQLELTFTHAILAGNEQHWDEAWKLFDQADHMASETGNLWIKALISSTRAEVLLKRGSTGDRAEAREQLNLVLDFYQHSQLPAWVEFVQNQISKLG